MSANRLFISTEMKGLVKAKHDITRCQLDPLNFDNALEVNGKGK